jgi:hypothetical protein
LICPWIIVIKHLVDHKQWQEVQEMRRQIYLSGMAVAVAMLIFAGGCASSSALDQPAPTSQMQSAVGTPNELSPMAPAEARNVRKVGNQWMCDLNGQAMVYNAASAKWEPKP